MPITKEDLRPRWVIPDDPEYQIIPGMRAMRRANGICYVQLHYSADPRKDEEWALNEGQDYGRMDWVQEYEMGLDTYRGKPCYGDSWARDVMVTPDAKYDPSVRLIRGWDFGLNPAVCIFQLKPDGFLDLVGELYTRDLERRSMRDFLPLFLAYMAGEFGSLSQRPIDVGDPSGWRRGEASAESAVDVLRENGIYPVEGPVPVQTRIDAVKWWMEHAIRGRPRLRVNPACEFWIAGADGAYHFPEAKVSVGGKKYPPPVKTEHSHLQDAGQYAAFRAKLMAAGKEREGQRRPLPDWRKGAYASPGGFSGPPPPATR